MFIVRLMNWEERERSAGYPATSLPVSSTALGYVTEAVPSGYFTCEHGLPPQHETFF